MDKRTIRKHYTVEIGPTTKDGQRQVQVFKQQRDPATKKPVGDPVILGDDDTLSLDLLVDVLPELTHDEEVRYDGGDPCF